MKINFITFADEKYIAYQKKLNKQAEGVFDIINSYTKNWLINTNFYKENKKILDLKRGAGYWLWKPYIIFESLMKLDNGDVIFYLDSGDTFKNEIIMFIKDHFATTDEETILIEGFNRQKDFTKRDCFILMDCDEEKYYNHTQLEAGNIIIKKSEKTMFVINEWLKFCKIEQIVTDAPNIYGKNLDGFKDHRHDQSILTNLAIKYNLNINNQLTSYVSGNVNQ